MADPISTYGPNYAGRRAEAANSQNIPSEHWVRVRPLPPEIDCNSCDPQLAQYFTVRLGGLTGSIFEACEGTHTLKWSSGCTWLDSTGRIYLLWYDSSNWIINAASPPSERDGQLRWTGPSDTCNPIYDYGSHSSCQNVPGADADCDDLGTTSCVVSGSVYSSSWTAFGPTHPHTGARIDQWPALRQAVTDLADGDKEFTLSWSIMNYGTDVAVPHEGGVIETNVVGFDASPGTTQEIRSDIQDAFTEWKELLESVFSPPEYGGQLTVTFDNNLPGQIQGVEGSGGVNVKSGRDVYYFLDPEVNGPPTPSNLGVTARAAGVGDIRIGVVDISDVAVTVKAGPDNRGRARQIGDQKADIYFNSKFPFRLEGLDEDARMLPLYNFSIKLVAAHEIGHSLGISGFPHDTGRSDPDNFPDPPFPLLTDMGGLASRYYKDFDYFFPDGLKASQWERRSLQEIYGYPPEE